MSATNVNRSSSRLFWKQNAGREKTESLFDLWMGYVDQALMASICHTSSDLPDYDYRSDFDSELEPRQCAENVLEELSEELEGWEFEPVEG
jgi:hypothetical protein